MGTEVEIAARMFADFNRGGFEAITWGVHPDVECIPFADWPGPSVYRGLDGWAELAAEWTESFDEYGFEVHSITPIDDGVLVLTTQHGRIKGEGDWMTMPVGAIWSDFEDGRARVVRWFRDWDEAIEAAAA